VGKSQKKNQTVDLWFPAWPGFLFGCPPQRFFPFGGLGPHFVFGGIFFLLNGGDGFLGAGFFPGRGRAGGAHVVFFSRCFRGHLPSIFLFQKGWGLLTGGGGGEPGAFPRMAIWAGSETKKTPQNFFFRGGEKKYKKRINWLGFGGGENPPGREKESKKTF